jgi:hypothetical protein
MANKPNFTQPALGVTDGAETNIVTATNCAAVYVQESPAASGWPRKWYYRATMPGSSQHLQAAGSSYRIPGPFAAGDVVGTAELFSAGGDSSTFNIAELSS